MNRKGCVSALIAALVVVACSADPGSPGTSPAVAVPTASTAATARPTPGPVASRRPAIESASPSPLRSTTYTPDDKLIAKVIHAAVAEAIPQLHSLNTKEPSTLVGVFEPLGTWITARKAEVTALTPSSCTAPAVAFFVDGLKQYDAIRKKFLAWKDWGLRKSAFPPGAPMATIRTFNDAVAALGAACSG